MSLQSGVILEKKHSSEMGRGTYINIKNLRGRGAVQIAWERLQTSCFHILGYKRQGNMALPNLMGNIQTY